MTVLMKPITAEMRINVPGTSSKTVTEVIAVSSNKKITYHLCFVG